MQGVRTEKGILWNGTTVPALVLDLDGTVRYSKSGGFIDGPDDVAVYGDVEAKIWAFRDKDWIIMGASNQGGVAWGYKTPEQAMAELDATLALLKPNTFHLVKQCYHMEGEKTQFPYNRRSLLRKPDYGMLALMESEAFEAGYLIDWDRSLFVGDRAEDQECALNARVPFMWAWEFFGRQRADVEEPAKVATTYQESRPFLGSRASVPGDVKEP